MQLTSNPLENCMISCMLIDYIHHFESIVLNYNYMRILLFLCLFLIFKGGWLPNFQRFQLSSDCFGHLCELNVHVFVFFDVFHSRDPFHS